MIFLSSFSFFSFNPLLSCVHSLFLYSFALFSHSISLSYHLSVFLFFFFSLIVSLLSKRLSFFSYFFYSVHLRYNNRTLPFFIFHLPVSFSSFLSLTFFLYLIFILYTLSLFSYSPPTILHSYLFLSTFFFFLIFIYISCLLLYSVVLPFLLFSIIGNLSVFLDSLHKNFCAELRLRLGTEYKWNKIKKRNVTGKANLLSFLHSLLFIYWWLGFMLRKMFIISIFTPVPQLCEFLFL